MRAQDPSPTNDEWVRARRLVAGEEHDVDRRDRARWPALRRGRGARSLRDVPGIAAAAVMLLLVLAGCWSEPPGEEGTPLAAIPAGEEGAAAPPGEEGGGGEEEPQVPPQEEGGAENGGGAPPGASPQAVVPLGTPKATPGTGPPRGGSPTARIPLSNPTEVALATRAAGGLPTASTTGGGRPGTRPGVPPLTVPDLETAEAMGVQVPPTLKTAVAEGTPITVPDLILTAEALGIEVPPDLQTAVAQGETPPELLELLTPDAQTPAAADGTPTTEATEEIGAAGSPGTDPGTDEPTATTGATETPTEPPLANGSLLIIKTDDAGNAVGGACFTLTDTGEGAVVGPLCDGDDADGDDADGRIRFDGVVPGEYTVAETTTPDGFLTAPAETVLVAPGVIEHEVVNVPVPTEVGGIIVTLVDEAGEPLVDEAGNALPDACVTAEPLGGGSPVAACDNGENDADPIPGIIRIENLPAGQFVVSQPQPPAGFQPMEPMEVAVEAGESLTLPPAEVEPAPPAAGGIRVLMTDEAGNLLPGACVTVTGAAEPVRACDNLPEDPDPEPGAIGFADLPVGPVTVVEERPPDGYPPATTVEQPAEVLPGQTVDVPFSHPAPQEPTPTPQPEATPVVLSAPVAFLNAADEFFVLVPGVEPAIPIGGAGSLDPAVEPAFSVDWRWLAFRAIEPEGLYLFDLEARQPLPPVDLGVAGRQTDLTWSPRGATLAVTVALEAGGSDVVLLDPEAGNPGRVFGDAGPAAAINGLEWAPDGLRLIVASTPAGGAPTVEIVDASTLARTPVTVGDGLAADAFFGWSSTGQILVRADNQLWIADPTSRTSVSLGEFVDVPVAPAWSDDGSAVAFYDAPADAAADADPDADADADGQLRIGTPDGKSCETGIVDVRVIAWQPGGAALAVVGARAEDEVMLEFVDTDCSADTALDNSALVGALGQPPNRLVWSADGNNLALISPPNANNAVEIALLSSTTGLLPVDDSTLVVGGIFGWTPDQPVLLLYGDPKFEQPPAEARLWAVPAESVLPTYVEGATTDGGYVKSAWPPPRQVEATEDDPAPRRDPPPPVPGSDSAGSTGGGAPGGAPGGAEPTTGSVEITSVDENGAAIAGVCVQLSGPVNYAPVCDGDQYDAATDLAGVVRIEGLTPGTYEIAEEGAPTPAAPETVEVVAGQMATATLERGAPDAGAAGGQTGVTATWTDQAGTPLPGGCLTLTTPAQGYGPVCDGDQYDQDQAPGVLLVVGVEAGTYTVTETTPPTGYAPATQPSATVEVSEGSVQPVNFVNAPA